MSKQRSREFLKRLVGDASFEAATEGVIRNHPRMADREVALRFVAFRLFAPDEYAQFGTLDEFLGVVTNKLDDSSGQRLSRLHADFVRGMTNSYSVFGRNAFRKWPQIVTQRSPINRALFESWGTVLADYDDSAVKTEAEGLADRARDLMTEDFEFITSISGSTGNARNVRTRFGKVRAIAMEVLGRPT